MIRSSSFRAIAAVPFFFVTVGPQASGLCAGQQDKEDRRMLPLSVVPAPPPGHAVFKEYSTRPIRWEEKEYTPSDAIPVLMGVAGGIGVTH